MKSYLFLILFYLFSLGQSYSQEKTETIYLSFNSLSDEKCKIETGDDKRIEIKKYSKKKENESIRFSICKELFALDKKSEIDTCNLNYLSKIKFETIKSIRKKREKLKDEHFFLNSVFKKIYIVEKYKDKIIKYPVVWGTDMVEN